MTAMVESCRKRKQNPLVISQRLGKLMGRNTRAAGLFQVEVERDGEGRASVRWCVRAPIIPQQGEWFRGGAGDFQRGATENTE